MTEINLVNKLKRKNLKAFKKFYMNYSGKMKYLLLRYVKDDMLAEDLLQDGFIKVLEKIDQFKFKGSFEGWVRQVFVSTALLYLRSNKQVYLYHENELEENENLGYSINEAFQDEDDIDEENMDNIDLIYNSEFNDEEFETLLNNLPEHYRIVFNMHVIDNIKHKEIAQILQINEKTSKSRLSKARKILRLKLYNLALEKKGWECQVKKT